MDKEKLIELSKVYFEESKELKEIFATPDGHFFHTEADASYHKAKTQCHLFKITRDELKPKKAPKESDKKDK